MQPGCSGTRRKLRERGDGTETGRRSSGSHAGLACTGSKHAVAQRAAAAVARRGRRDASARVQPATGAAASCALARACAQGAGYSSRRQQAACACLREGDALLSAGAGSSNASTSSKARQHRGEKERGNQRREKTRKEKRERKVWEKRVKREK
jgi:hypothetical protein